MESPSTADPFVGQSYTLIHPQNHYGGMATASVGAQQYDLPLADKESHDVSSANHVKDMNSSDAHLFKQMHGHTPY